MKLIIAIIRDNDNESVSQGLISAGFRVTRVASTGGFLRRGNTTIMLGVADEKVDQAIEVIRSTTAAPIEPGMKRATLFVLDIHHYEQV